MKTKMKRICIWHVSVDSLLNTESRAIRSRTCCASHATKFAVPNRDNANAWLTKCRMTAGIQETNKTNVKTIRKGNRKTMNKQQWVDGWHCKTSAFSCTAHHLLLSLFFRCFLLFRAVWRLARQATSIIFYSGWITMPESSRRSLESKEETIETTTTPATGNKFSAIKLILQPFSAWPRPSPLAPLQPGSFIYPIPPFNPKCK